jgi:RNA polymerase sigma-70 factor (ECF subfamily)
LVVNRAYSHLRQRKLWGVISRLFWLEPELAESPELDAEQRRHHARLGEALERLPMRQRVAFTLRSLEALSLDEVAQAMHIDRGTVRVHVQRAVKALRGSGVLGGETT